MDKTRVHKVNTGSRHKVWNGTALKTTGGLKKADLFMNSRRRIVSRVKHFGALQDNRLVKHGYLTRKGKFGFYRMSDEDNNVVRVAGKKPMKRESATRSRKRNVGLLRKNVNDDDDDVVNNVRVAGKKPMKRGSATRLTKSAESCKPKTCGVEKRVVQSYCRKKRNSR